MHYVTEDELREAYGARPFEKYELPEGARLTPSARQFLIDFRIEFEDDEQGPRPRGDKRGAHGRPHREPAADLGALVFDANLLGARLRLLARRALGVDNTVAHRTERVGRKWQEARHASDLVADDGHADQGGPPPGPAPIPTFDAGIHPIFFEMACVHAQIGRGARSWARAKEGLGPGEARIAAAWVGEATTMCEMLEEAIGNAEEEV